MNLSLDAVATQLKVTKQAVSSWENGTRECGSIRLADMCLIYGVSSDFILYGTHMVPQMLRDVFARAGAARRTPRPPTP